MTRSVVQPASQDDSQDPDSLPSLPPLDRLDDDDVPIDDAPPGLVPLDDGSAVSRDLDEAAIDLDVGIKIDELRAGDEDTAQEVVLDMTELLNLADDQAEDDSVGIEGLDVGQELDEPPSGSDDGSAEGLDEELEYLVADDLPQLDADDDGLFEVDPTWSLDQSAQDEPPPPWTEHPWRLVLDEIRAGSAELPTLTIPAAERVISCTQVAPRAALVVERGRLALAMPAGDGFSFHPLDTEGQRIAGGEQPLITHLEEKLIALGDPREGVAVSVDGGQRFERVLGCAGVTAMTTGRVEGQQVLWLALYRDEAEVSELVQVDITLVARRIASIEAESQSDEWSRITELRWDEPSHQVIAHGEFGTARFVPPRQ